MEITNTSGLWDDTNIVLNSVGNYVAITNLSSYTLITNRSEAELNWQRRSTNTPTLYPFRPSAGETNAFELKDDAGRVFAVAPNPSRTNITIRFPDAVLAVRVCLQTNVFVEQLDVRHTCGWGNFTLAIDSRLRPASTSDGIHCSCWRKFGENTQVLRVMEFQIDGELVKTKTLEYLSHTTRVFEQTLSTNRVYADPH